MTEVLTLLLLMNYSKTPTSSVKIKTFSTSGLKMATYWSEKMERAAL